MLVSNGSGFSASADILHKIRHFQSRGVQSSVWSLIAYRLWCLDASYNVAFDHRYFSTGTVIKCIVNCTLRSWKLVVFWRLNVEAVLRILWQQLVTLLACAMHSHFHYYCSCPMHICVVFLWQVSWHAECGTSFTCVCVSVVNALDWFGLDWIGASVWLTNGNRP